MTERPCGSKKSGGRNKIHFVFLQASACPANDFKACATTENQRVVFL
ncbi:hypothetical protein ACEN9D_04240 [Pseudomonas sp. CT11-2]|nr:hypothetical protein [Pseudomonas sp. B21-019]UVM35767.1 hypothetical protein LOY36_14040 [Pseudomonas sp. B21-019]